MNTPENQHVTETVSRASWHPSPPERMLYGIYPIYRAQVGKRDTTVMVPAGKLKGPLLKWVAYHTGAGEDSRVITGEGDTEKPPIIKMLLENGFLVCTITSGKEHWGDPSAEEAHEDLYQYVKTVFPVQIKVNILAQSMGGTSAYPWASSHPGRVCRIYGIYPVTNLESMGNRNPIRNLKPLADHDISIMHRHGTDDKSVPFEQNARQFEETYKRLGGNIRIIPVAGVGHQVHPLMFIPEEVSNFFMGRL